MLKYLRREELFCTGTRVFYLVLDWYWSISTGTRLVLECFQSATGVLEITPNNDFTLLYLKVKVKLQKLRWIVFVFVFVFARIFERKPPLRCDNHNAVHASRQSNLGDLSDQFRYFILILNNLFIIIYHRPDCKFVQCQSKFYYVIFSCVRKLMNQTKDVWYGGNLNLHFPLSIEYQHIEIHA